MIKIEDTKVYGLDEAITNIGLSYDKPQRNYQLALKLANTPSCSGHDSFLKGIVVNFKLTAPHYFIIEMQRYHNIDIVMSTSKMHSLTNFDFIRYNLPPTVDDRVLEVIKHLWDSYIIKHDSETLKKLLDNMPMGFQLTMAMTTNYLQLKNIYNQRLGHKLSGWGIFCEWIKSLPMFEEIFKEG